jgi:hypothetical protein
MLCLGGGKRWTRHVRRIRRSMRTVSFCRGPGLLRGLLVPLSRWSWTKQDIVLTEHRKQETTSLSEAFQQLLHYSSTCMVIWDDRASKSVLARFHDSIYDTDEDTCQTSQSRRGSRVLSHKGSVPKSPAPDCRRGCMYALVIIWLSDLRRLWTIVTLSKYLLAHRLMRDLPRQTWVSCNAYDPALRTNLLCGCRSNRSKF